MKLKMLAFRFLSYDRPKYVQNYRLVHLITQQLLVFHACSFPFSSSLLLLLLLFFLSFSGQIVSRYENLT